MAACTTALAIGATMMVVAGPAQAAPRDCMTYYFLVGGASICTTGEGGPGEHRVVLTCSKLGPSLQALPVIYGPWVPDGMSVAYCFGPGTFGTFAVPPVLDVTMQTR